MTPRPSTAGVLALALAGITAGCGRSSAADNPAAAGVPAISAAAPSGVPLAPSGSSPRSSPTAVGRDRITQLATPSAYPSYDAASRQGALITADAAMRAFAQPQVSSAAWWAGLAPLLSPVAAQAYQGTDPATVPAHQVTGPARLTGDPGTPYLVRVAVPTDVGIYLVLLSRAGQSRPWLVERLTPPPGIGR